jgi:ferredoxin
MPYIIIIDECISCGECAEECPSEAIEGSGSRYVIDQDKCTECGTCVEICPQEAIAEE